MNKSTCQRCKIEFSYSPWENTGKYCSKQCFKRPKKSPRFEWNKATEEEKKQRIIYYFNKNAIKNEVGCWEWLGGTYPNGYAKMNCSPNGIRPLGHRISWLIHHGDIPTDKIICHTCDNRACTRPDHLFLGTQSDNIRDMHKKRRGLLGDTHTNSKLNSVQVVKIKELLNSNLTHREIAEMFNISRTTITFIKNGKNWAHIKV